ncbi:hypothetical protein [Nocardia sp. NPDC004711]
MSNRVTGIGARAGAKSVNSWNLHFGVRGAKVPGVEFTSVARSFTISIEPAAGPDTDLRITLTVCHAATVVCFSAGVVSILIGAYTDAGTVFNLVGVVLWLVALAARFGVFAITRSRSGHAP